MIRKRNYYFQIVKFVAAVVVNHRHHRQARKSGAAASGKPRTDIAILCEPAGKTTIITISGMQNAALQELKSP